MNNELTKEDDYNNVIVCTRCIMDNRGDNTIHFEKDGTCNYCNEALDREKTEYYPNEIGEEKLMHIMSQMKSECANDKYDCMVGISGGVDSSYILYLGYKFKLRMLAVHIDDDFDTDIAKINIENLCKATNTELIMVKPDREQYADTLHALLKASVPNLAIVQDNLLVSALIKTAKEYKIKYSLAGGNFALESILQRGNTHNAFDKRNIKDIERKFGNMKWDKLDFISMTDKYIGEKYFSKTKKIYPLNYIDYNLEKVLQELKDFCGYEYYGGKHYESILTRFLQCYYLPNKYNFDKRKSHLSSMIISGQLTREEALEKMNKSPYIAENLLEYDMQYISEYLNISVDQLKKLISREPKQHSDYKVSLFNIFAPLARKLRRFLG